MLGRAAQGAQLGCAMAAEAACQAAQGDLPASVRACRQIGPSKFLRQMRKAFEAYQRLVLAVYLIN